MTHALGTRYGICAPADLLARCVVDEATGCWLWRGSLCDGKYPRVWAFDPAYGRTRTMTGTRAAWLLAGRVPRAGRRIYLTCSALACVNVAHMCEGTAAQFGAHVVASGSRRGDPLRQAINTRNGRARAKLSEADVARIRASDQTSTALARELGVAHGTVSSVRRGRTWRPVLAAASVFTWGGGPVAPEDTP